MPIITYASLDAVPEPFRDIAKTVEGKEEVTINVVAEAKLTEFRDNNIKVTKERDALKQSADALAAIVGEDPEKFTAELAELRQTADRVKDGTLTESRQIEEQVLKRTEDMRKGYEDQIRTKSKESEAWKKQHDDLDRNYRREKVTNAIRSAASREEAGVSPTALEDIVERGLKVFRCEDDGRIKAFEGDAPLYGNDGVSPITAGEWIAKLKNDAPHFFKGTQGSGAGGGQSSVHGVSKDALKRMTPQQRLGIANGEKPPSL